MTSATEIFPMTPSMERVALFIQEHAPEAVDSIFGLTFINSTHFLDLSLDELPIDLGTRADADYKYFTMDLFGRSFDGAVDSSGIRAPRVLVKYMKQLSDFFVPFHQEFFIPSDGDLSVHRVAVCSAVRSRNTGAEGVQAGYAALLDYDSLTSSGQELLSTLYVQDEVEWDVAVGAARSICTV